MSSKEERIDIFQMLVESIEKKRKERINILESIGVEEYFKEGNIRINTKTCKGVECKLCIKACPTNALYLRNGEVKIIEDLCIYCAACVLSCIVDNCIQINRKRRDGKIERYGTLTEVFKIMDKINSKKRLDVTDRRFPSLEKLLEDCINNLRKCRLSDK